MSFTADQVAALKAPLDRANVKSRQQGGSSVSYVEGYHAENEANRIFGFDAWDRITVDFRCVMERERKFGKGQYEKDGWGVSYIAKVRIEVRAGDTVVVREGTGAGHGIDADLGQAHESALKEAETDAEKRALKTFGNPFGQALYDKTQSEVADAPREPAKVEELSKQQLDALALIDECDTLQRLDLWLEEYGKHFPKGSQSFSAANAAFSARKRLIGSMDRVAA